MSDERRLEGLKFVGGARFGNDGVSDDRRREPDTPGRVMVRLDEVDATESRRGSSVNSPPLGRNPTERNGLDSWLTCDGGTGEMTLRPRGVSDPRRGWCV